MNIVISKNVLASLDKYSKYLVKMGYKEKTRAIEKKNMIINAVYNGLAPVANGVQKHNLSPYKGLGRDRGCLLFTYTDKKSTTQWGFAYKIFEKNVVVLYMQNMQLAANSYNTNQPQQNNQQQQTQSNKITWQFLRNSQFHHGFAIVQATNYRGLYNFVKQDKKTILSPSQWFKTCENFTQWKENGAIMAKVSLENDPEWRFINIQGRIYKKDKKTGKYIAERRRINVFDEKLLEHVVSESIDKMIVEWEKDFNDPNFLFYL